MGYWIKPLNFSVHFLSFVGGRWPLDSKNRWLLEQFSDPEVEFNVVLDLNVNDQFEAHQIIASKTSKSDQGQIRLLLDELLKINVQDIRLKIVGTLGEVQFDIVHVHFITHAGDHQRKLQYLHSLGNEKVNGVTKIYTGYVFGDLRPIAREDDKHRFCRYRFFELPLVMNISTDKVIQMFNLNE